MTGDLDGDEDELNDEVNGEVKGDVKAILYTLSTTFGPDKGFRTLYKRSCNKTSIAVEFVVVDNSQAEVMSSRKTNTCG